MLELGFTILIKDETKSQHDMVWSMQGTMYLGKINNLRFLQIKFVKILSLKIFLLAVSTLKKLRNLDTISMVTNILNRSEEQQVFVDELI